VDRSEVTRDMKLGTEQAARRHARRCV